MSAQGNGLKGQRPGENGNPTIFALKGQYMSAQGNGLKGQRLGENSNPIIYALKGQYKYLIHASMSQSLSKRIYMPSSM